MNRSKLPHTLRIIVFLLRLTLGLNFFYLGFTTLFNHPLGEELGGRSLGNLYAWIAGTASGTPLQVFSAWAFLTIGACLILGLMTRLASITGIALTLASYVPNVTFSPLNPSQFANDAALAVVCLLIIIFADAGSYLGLDAFIHIHLAGKHK